MAEQDLTSSSILIAQAQTDTGNSEAQQPGNAAGTNDAVEEQVVQEANDAAQGITVVVEGSEVVAADPAVELHAETQGAYTEQEKSVFPPFDSSTFGPQLFWLALTFGVLYLLMSKIALPRIGEILEVRRDRIEGDLAEAERLRQKTDQAIEAFEAELAEARAKSHGIADETRAKIKSEMDAKRRDVEADLAKQVATAEARILKTKTDALANVDQIAAETAVAVVGKLAGKVSIKDARVAVSDVVKG